MQDRPAGAEVQVLDLNDYEMPIYSIDREQESGIPQLAHDFKKVLGDSDGIVISFAEHNGSYSVAFKNVMDWMSRIDRDVWSSKPMMLLATSPGGRGGQSVLNLAVNGFKFMNQNKQVSFSLPSFQQNFSEDEGITDAGLKAQFDGVLIEFAEAL